jgi:septum formation protein
MTGQLILASGSPRRKLLLEQLAINFEIEPPDVDESLLAGEEPEAYVTRLAEKKAHTIAVKHDGAEVVLGADTIVVLLGEILGKPESKGHGVQMLNELSGMNHDVLTGVSICNGSRTETFCVKTEVTFRQLREDEIAWYWETGEPCDKAGSYGLQGAGAAFVETVTGSYSNVIGLPLSETVMMLRDFSIDCLGHEGLSLAQGK